MMMVMIYREDGLRQWIEGGMNYNSSQTRRDDNMHYHLVLVSGSVHGVANDKIARSSVNTSEVVLRD